MGTTSTSTFKPVSLSIGILLLGIMIGVCGVIKFYSTVFASTIYIPNNGLLPGNSSIVDKQHLLTSRTGLSASVHSFQRNVIIGAAVNMGLLPVYRFARSARASCSHCALMLIVTDRSISLADFQQLAAIYSIEFISYEKYLPVDVKSKQPGMHIHSTRWIVINRYFLALKASGQMYDNVFLCDTQDTVFQTNVFTHMKTYGSGVYAFLEDVNMSIGKCPINARWIRICYGEKMLQSLSNRSISCSGTVLGTWSAIAAYLSTMESELMTRSEECTAVPGSDQGIHNFIVHNNGVQNTMFYQISHENGFVGTLGYASWMNRNEFGLALNANMSVYAVIHQWNRSKQMIAQFDREYQILSDRILNRKN